MFFYKLTSDALKHLNIISDFTRDFWFVDDIKKRIDCFQQFTLNPKSMKSTYQILYKRTFLSYIDIKTKKKDKKKVVQWVNGIFCLLIILRKYDLQGHISSSHVQQHASTTALFCVFTLNNTAIIKHLHLSICQVILWSLSSPELPFTWDSVASERLQVLSLFRNMSCCKKWDCMLQTWWDSGLTGTVESATNKLQE